MLHPIVRLLKLASIGVCLIVVASFVIFVVQQTKAASGRQTEVVARSGATASVPPGSPTARAKTNGREGAVHKAIDEASTQLTLPFAGISSSNSEWTNRGVKLVLALLVYGFGLGYLTRVLRVRV